MKLYLFFVSIFGYIYICILPDIFGIFTVSYETDFPLLYDSHSLHLTFLMCFLPHITFPRYWFGHNIPYILLLWRILKWFTICISFNSNRTPSFYFIFINIRFKTVCCNVTFIFCCCCRTINIHVRRLRNRSSHNVGNFSFFFYVMMSFLLSSSNV